MKDDHVDNLKDLYDYYRGTNAKLFEDCRIKRTHAASEREKIRQRLFELRRWLDKYCLYSVKDISNGKVTHIDDLKFKFKLGVPAGHRERYNEVKGLLERYINYSNDVRNCQNILNILDAKYEEYQVFLYIVKRFNILIYEELLNGYTFDMVNGVGKLNFVIKNKTPKIDKNGNATFPINWHESLKMKRELVANNQTPFHKDDAPKGIKWLIYHIEPYPYLVWTKAKQYAKSNIAKYSFKPSRKAVIILNKRLKSDEFATINFKRN